MEYDFNKYTNKTIMIIGGGTSTLDVNWQNLDYDYVWTCNDFYLEPRVLSQNIDLFALSFTNDLSSSVLRSKLKQDKPFIYYDKLGYRGKENSIEFKEFHKSIETDIFEMSIPFNEATHLPNGRKNPKTLSGITFRLINLALLTKAKNIYFVGFDGWNKEFSNIHAFTKKVGLKDSDTRRDYEGTDYSFMTVFTDSYNYFLTMPGYKRLQNLGEGQDYNIGTTISKKHFPLIKEVYEKIR